MHVKISMLEEAHLVPVDPVNFLFDLLVHLQVFHRYLLHRHLELTLLIRLLDLLIPALVRDLLDAAHHLFRGLIDLHLRVFLDLCHLAFPLALTIEDVLVVGLHHIEEVLVLGLFNILLDYHVHVVRNLLQDRDSRLPFLV